MATEIFAENFCTRSDTRNPARWHFRCLATHQRCSSELSDEFMLQDTICYFRRFVLLSIASVAFFFSFVVKTAAKGFSFSGVTDGSAIALVSGTAPTNLAITATPTIPAGTTNL